MAFGSNPTNVFVEMQIPTLRVVLHGIFPYASLLCRAKKLRIAFTYRLVEHADSVGFHSIPENTLE
uniref:Uncharacterized protein n=1 Tax=mine drainage metagenome TaxID=410659 RepID=E6PX90_9ZZZZ